MEKRRTWSGIRARAWSQFFPPLFQNIVLFCFSGSLICYEFLSPLTPHKVFSWRSWQIESDRQTGSSVRPQESPSSRAVSPSVHHWSRALIAWLSVASKAVNPSGPFTVLSAPWKEREEPLMLNEPMGKEENSVTCKGYYSCWVNSHPNGVTSIEWKTPKCLARL